MEASVSAVDAPRRVPLDANLDVAQTEATELSQRPLPAGERLAAVGRILVGRGVAVGDDQVEALSMDSFVYHTSGPQNLWTDEGNLMPFEEPGRHNESAGNPRNRTVAAAGVL